MDAYEEEKAAQKILDDQWKRQQISMEKARQQVYARMKADAEAERIEAERTANLPAPEQTQFPIAGLHFINGVVQPAKEKVVSQAVVKTQQLTEFNKNALSNIPVRGVQRIK